MRPPRARAARACHHAVSGSSSARVPAATRCAATQAAPSLLSPRRSRRASASNASGVAHSGRSGQVSPMSSARRRDPVSGTRGASVRSGLGSRGRSRPALFPPVAVVAGTTVGPAVEPFGAVGRPVVGCPGGGSVRPVAVARTTVRGGVAIGPQSGAEIAPEVGPGRATVVRSTAVGRGVVVGAGRRGRSRRTVGGPVGGSSVRATVIGVAVTVRPPFRPIALDRSAAGRTGRRGDPSARWTRGRSRGRGPSCEDDPRPRRAGAAGPSLGTPVVPRVPVPVGTLVVARIPVP